MARLSNLQRMTAVKLRSPGWPDGPPQGPRHHPGDRNFTAVIRCRFDRRAIAGAPGSSSGTCNFPRSWPTNREMRPLIGVTTSELRPGSLATLQRAGAPPHPEIMLGTTYLRAIDAAGAIPVILSPVDLAAVPELVGRLDGICLAGGPDLDPVAYGRPHAPSPPWRDGRRRRRVRARRRARRRCERTPAAGHLPRRPGAQRRARRDAAPARRRPPPGRGRHRHPRRA